MFYRPPREFAPLRLTGGFALAACSAVLLAWAYVRVLPELNTIHFLFTAPFAFGVALGLACMLMVHLGRVRRSALAILLSCAVGLIALYATWVLWIQQITQRWGAPVPLTGVIVHPIGAAQVVNLINREGTRQYKGEPVAGGLLFVLWTLEGLIIVIAPAVMGNLAVKSQKPVCPTCGVDCPRDAKSIRFSGHDPDQFRNQVLARNFDSLLAHGPLLHDDAPQIDLSIHACPKCGEFHVLTVTTSAWVLDGNKRPTVQTTTLVDRMLIPRHEAERLRAMREQLQAMRQAETEREEAAAEPSESEKESEPT